MAEIRNYHGGNVHFRICLLDNKWTDIVIGRDDGENYISFALTLVVDGDVLEYPPERGATFTIRELASLLEHIRNAVQTRRCAPPFRRAFERLHYVNSEGYFAIALEDSLEEDRSTIEIWFSMGSLTQGKRSGYERGVRFDVRLDDLGDFANNLDMEIRAIVRQRSHGAS